MTTSVRFTLPSGVNGDQLTEELRRKVKVDISGAYTFHPPNIIEIAGAAVRNKRAEVQQAINEHIPAESLD